MNVTGKSATWFEVGIHYEKTTESGLQKMVTEKYVFKGQDFLSAYTAAVEYADGLMREYGVVTMAIAPYSEYVHRDDDASDDILYKVKIAFIMLDEKSGKKKKTCVYILVLADSLNTAREITEAYLKGTMADYTIESVSKTSLVEVID